MHALMCSLARLCSRDTCSSARWVLPYTTCIGVCVCVRVCVRVCCQPFCCLLSRPRIQASVGDSVGVLEFDAVVFACDRPVAPA